MWSGLLSETGDAQLTPAGGAFLLVRQVVGILNAQADAPEMVRVTLKPLQRVDGRPAFPGTPTNGVAYPGLRAGFSSIGVVPVVNPIATGNRPTGQANYVHVAWGVGGARQHELLADWPQTGASIELVADNVQVDGVCGETPGLAVPALSVGSQPRFAADLAPSHGRARGEYDALSFTQILSGTFATGQIVQAAVPEFATALQIGLGDAMPAGSVLEVAWADAANQLMFLGRYGAPAAGTEANLVMPLRLSVPDGAVFMSLNGVVLGAVVTTATAEWRISP